MESVDAKALEALAAVFYFFFSELGLHKVVLELIIISFNQEK